MYSALTVADEILRIAKRQGITLTPMQLVKLTYIAHGWALAVLDRDLFTDRIEAWKYGPVIPNLYRMTKHFGRKPIPHNLINDQGESTIDNETRRFLEDVVSKYGHLSGYALSNMTHKPGTPWDEVYREGVMNIEIPDSLIRNHYQAKLNEYRRSSAA